MKRQEDKSSKHRARMKDLTFLIRANQTSVLRLHAFASGKETLKGKGYTTKAENYRRTAEDAQRLPKTIQNLQFQTALLQKELEVLRSYDE